MGLTRIPDSASLSQHVVLLAEINTAWGKTSPLLSHSFLPSLLPFTFFGSVLPL